MAKYDLVSEYEPRGDQPDAVRELSEGLKRGDKYQTLLGVTGSGKTFTMANVIANYGLPTLVISHNKTLAAQLYGELKAYFPNNAVEFFISYYDYYQPEAYVPSTDTYIEKDTSINDDIDRLRLRATSSLMSREDVIIVASVSCIYGLGSPSDWKEMMVFIETGQHIERNRFLRDLIDIHYSRNDIDFGRGTFRVRGDVVEIHPAYEDFGVRVEFFGDEIDRVSRVDLLTGEVKSKIQKMGIFPAKHFVTTRAKLEKAIGDIEAELEERVQYFRDNDMLLEAQRIASRTKYDIEMMLEIGYCSGIENYSRHLSGRNPGDRPYTLLDFFPDKFLTIIDESHQTLPQVRGMYNGDRSRKKTLVDFGFRLPSALDNRPLFFEEFESLLHQAIYVSATPGDYEIQKCDGVVVEQIIRPTGLLDPVVTVKPAKNQVDDLVEQIKKRIAANERVLVTTLTKRMAEDLSDYLQKLDIKVRYLHSEIDAIDRVEILRDLRLAEFDVLVGINLLREGLDLPEVSLVAILDADKEGFLRSERSLIQTAGRAARNLAGEVILYADNITNSIKKTVDETDRRRKIQEKYNEENRITPQTIYKSREDIMRSTLFADSKTQQAEEVKFDFEKYNDFSISEKMVMLEEEMLRAAKNLEFEKAALIRDELLKMKKEIKAVK
ncbi:MAG: excinuclease ABC subunit UvrB [candidate division Zixibacteria bacterium]|nr:excinuclease ABC subunit UvrB [candidate division Zixibacteria bacterium]